MKRVLAWICSFTMIMGLAGVFLPTPVYAVEKDFYWALFMGDEQLTPYAFTSIEAICSDREFEPYEKIDKKPCLCHLKLR